MSFDKQSSNCFLRSWLTLLFLDQQCDLLLDPVNGEVHQTGRYLGDRAIYTCGHGWEIVGAEERVCQANGEWSNQEPYCKKRGKRENTYLVLSNVFVGQSVSFGNEIYLCIEGYKKNSAMFRVK